MGGEERDGRGKTGKGREEEGRDEGEYRRRTTSFSTSIDVRF